MEARYMLNSDYPMLVEWWKANRFPVQNFEDLPIVNGELQGVVVEKDKTPLCAGFIIETTISTGVMIEYIVSNYEIKDKKLRKESQIYLLKSMAEVCKSMGKKFVFSSIKNPSLVVKYQEAGFIKDDTPSVEMVKILT